MTKDRHRSSWPAVTATFSDDLPRRCGIMTQTLRRLALHAIAVDVEYAFSSNAIGTGARSRHRVNAHGNERKRGSESKPSVLTQMWHLKCHAPVIVYGWSRAQATLTIELAPFHVGCGPSHADCSWCCRQHACHQPPARRTQLHSSKPCRLEDLFAPRRPGLLSVSNRGREASGGVCRW